MSEHIYTIPVNEAFDACSTENEEGEHRCPFCRIYKKLENDELEFILGAAMMEPDVRIKANEQGFCHKHFQMMLGRKNRLGLALILESHLDKQRESYGKTGLLTSITGKGGSGEIEHTKELNESCFVCSRIEYTFTRIFKNAALLWDEETDFRKKTLSQPYFCLPHYGMWLEAAQSALGRKKFPDFHADVSKVMLNYYDELKNDVSWFCKKFDYRYENEPWGNSKDACERAAAFLSGEDPQ